MAVDYDAAEVTERERMAAENQKAIADYNANALKQQLNRQLANYDFANAQNRQLADVELKQNSRKNEADRFEAMRNLQNSALGLLGSMGNQAMNSSSLYNLGYMLNNRNDSDNNTFWNQLQVNQNAVNNAYDESANQNQVSKNDAIINTEKALSDMEADLAANLNNINPSLYEAPGGHLGSSGYSSSSYNYGGSGTGGAQYNTGSGTSGYGSTSTFVDPHVSELSSYIMPDNSAQAARDIDPRNQVRRNDYFARLLNGFNGR